MKNRNKKNSARDLIKLKSTYTARETIMKENDNTQSGENSLQANISTSNSSAKQANGTCSSKTHTHTHTHTHTQQKWAKDLNGYFPKECIQISIRCMKRCSASLMIGEMQIRTTMRCQLKITESDYPPKDLQRLNSARSRGKRNHSTLGAGI